MEFLTVKSFTTAHACEKILCPGHLIQLYPHGKIIILKYSNYHCTLKIIVTNRLGLKKLHCKRQTVAIS